MAAAFFCRRYPGCPALAVFVRGWQAPLLTISLDTILPGSPSVSILLTLSLVSLPFGGLLSQVGMEITASRVPVEKKTFQPGWKPATVLVTAASLETERDVPPHTRVLHMTHVAECVCAAHPSKCVPSVRRPVLLLSGI
jgi:hypothetical protein